MVIGYKLKPPIIDSNILPDSAFFIGSVEELALPNILDALELGERELPAYKNFLTFGDVLNRIGKVDIYDSQGSRNVLRFVPHTYLNMNTNIITHELKGTYLDAVASILYGQDREFSSVGGGKSAAIVDVDYKGRMATHHRNTVVENGSATAVGTYTLTSANISYWDYITVYLLPNALGTGLVVSVRPKGAASYKNVGVLYGNDAARGINISLPLGFYAAYDLQYVISGNAAVSVSISAFGS